MLRRRAWLLLTTIFLASRPQSVAAQASFSVTDLIDPLVSLVRLILERRDAAELKRTKQALPHIILELNEIAKIKEQCGDLTETVFSVVGRPCDSTCEDVIQRLGVLQGDLHTSVARLNRAITSLDPTWHARNLATVELVRRTSDARAINVASLAAVVETVQGSRRLMRDAEIGAFFRRQKPEAEQIRALIETLQKMLPAA